MYTKSQQFCIKQQNGGELNRHLLKITIHLNGKIIPLCLYIFLWFYDISCNSKECSFIVIFIIVITIEQ